MKVSDFVEGKLMEIGATPEYTGYKYLVCAIVMSMQNEYLLNNVTTKMYPAIQSEIEWTQEKLYMKSNPENWFAVPRTATQPDALQGFHADHLLYIIDEASRC